MAQRRSRLNYLIIISFLVTVGLGAWLWWRLLAPLPAPMRLAPSPFRDLPGWEQSNPNAALAAFGRSCVQLAKQPASEEMPGAGYAGIVGDWQRICRAIPVGTLSSAMARHWFETWFSPARISGGSIPKGLFTGYYEPELRASRTKHGPYQTPIYGQPADLVTVDLGLFRPGLHQEHIAGRLTGHELIPYPSRAEIDAKGLTTAPVLFWAEDPVAVFFLHIQGSGRALFDDGSTARIAYAAQNGRPYTAIGHTLIAEGALPREGVSLQSIRAWLDAHPQNARRVMETNASYVFFRETPLGNPQLGSVGSEGVDLTPGASLAVDQRLHPLGVPFFVDATKPDPDDTKPDVPLHGLLIAQDTGGAIRGPVRGDVFWGFGKDAQAIAGRMKADGRMFVLLPKAVAARLGAGKEFPVAGK